MRSDSVRVSDTALSKCEILSAAVSERNICPKNLYLLAEKDAQDAHEAIRRPMSIARPTMRIN
jgi:DNA topoisomerase IA